jgi:hypothetical protein
MILSFSLPQFVELIKAGNKKHTIRGNKTNRWQVGREIHFWSGNPLNVSLSPYQFGAGVVTGIDIITIAPKEDLVFINQKQVVDLQALAVAEGFGSWVEMKAFFDKDFSGSLIHFSFSPKFTKGSKSKRDKLFDAIIAKEKELAGAKIHSADMADAGEIQAMQLKITAMQDKWAKSK